MQVLLKDACPLQYGWTQRPFDNKKNRDQRNNYTRITNFATRIKVCSQLYAITVLNKYVSPQWKFIYHETRLLLDQKSDNFWISRLLSNSIKTIDNW